MLGMFIRSTGSLLGNLLCSQCLDGIEPGRLSGRIDLEENSNKSRENQSNSCHPPLEAHWKRRKLPDGQSDQKATCDSDQASHYALGKGFDKKLPEDVALSRSYGPADADLFGPFRY